jgi:tetratricopeptide (TPR) repeat protein
VLALLVASWISLAPPADAAPSEAVDLSEARRLFDEGNARYDAADYKGAIEVFTRALTEIRGRGVDDFQIRARLLFNIGRSHMRAYEINHDVEHLRQARSIFTRLLEESERFPGEVDEDDVASAHEQLAEIERLLAAAEQPSDAPPPPFNAERPDPRPFRVRGIGLISGGAALLGAGVGMLAWGGGFGSAAETQVAGLDDLGLPSDSAAFADGQDFITAERRKGAAWMAAGGVSAVLGVVGVAVGVQQLVKANKLSPRSLSAGLTVNREGAGLSVSGRF